MSQINHTIEPIRARGGLRRLRRGDIQDQREHTETVLGRPAFRSALQTEMERADQDDLTLLVAAVRFQPLPGQSEDQLAGQKLPDELVDRIRSVNANVRLVVVSGSELLLLVPSLRRRPDGEAVVQQLIEVLSAPLHVDGMDHHLTPLVGAAMLGQESPSADLLVDGARLALAESDKLQPAMMFHPYQRVRRERRSEMQADLRAAVLAEEIEVALQPAFDLETDKLVAMEAFARWNRVDKGPVPPFEFVPLAMELGVGHLLSRQVLQRSIELVAEARGTGFSFQDVTLWINVAPDDIVHPEFSGIVREALKADHGVTVGLELSPTPDADAREVHEVLKRLVSRGVRVAIGDFGIGNANLTVLQQLPFDAVKLDRALIRQIALSDEAAQLVGALVEMASLLGLETTAQGIEAQSQRDVVAGLDCSIGQGYFYAEPSDDPEVIQSWWKS